MRHATQGGSSDTVATGASTTTTWTPANGSGSTIDWATITAVLHAAAP